MTNLQDALLSAKGKFQSNAYNAITFIFKNICRKHIYIKSLCMFFRDIDTCVPA